MPLTPILIDMIALVAIAFIELIFRTFLTGDSKLEVENTSLGCYTIPFLLTELYSSSKKRLLLPQNMGSQGVEDFAIQ